MKVESDITGSGPQDVPRKITVRHLVGGLPHPDLRLKQGQLQKQGLDGKFSEKVIILTKKSLILTDVSVDYVKDSVPLHEIVELKIEMPDAADMASLLNTNPSTYLAIYTDEEGHNSGATYLFLAPPADLQSWHGAIAQARRAALAVHERLAQPSLIARARRRLRAAHESKGVQRGVAALVFLNFLSTAAQAELQPAPGSQLDQAFATLVRRRPARLAAASRSHHCRYACRCIYIKYEFIQIRINMQEVSFARLVARPPLALRHP